MSKIENDFYFPYSLNYFSHITNDQDEETHGHDFYEFALIIHGSIFHRQNDLKQTELLSQNDLLLIPTGNTHTYKRLPKQNCSHRDILFRNSFFEETCARFNNDLYKQLCVEKKIVKVKLNEQHIQSINYYVEQLLPHKQLSTEQFNSITQALLITLLSFLLMFSQNSKQSTNYPTWINKLIQSIERNSIFSTSWDEIYADIPYSKEHISRTFKKYTGTTLTKFINNHKIQYAAYLLVSTNLSITHILKEINISSPVYFTKLFKEKYTLSPHQYRLAHNLS